MKNASISACPFHDFSRRHIRSLVRFFALKCAQDRGLPIRPLSPDAEDLLMSHDWHGDLAAMEATVRHAAIMADGDRIGPETIRLPDGPAGAATDGSGEGGKLRETATRVLLGRTVSEVECELILLTVECCGGNRTQAADILGISVRTLRNKLKEYAHFGIRIPPIREAKRIDATGTGRPMISRTHNRRRPLTQRSCPCTIFPIPCVEIVLRNARPQLRRRRLATSTITRNPCCAPWNGWHKPTAMMRSRDFFDSPAPKQSTSGAATIRRTPGRGATHSADA